MTEYEFKVIDGKTYRRPKAAPAAPPADAETEAPAPAKREGFLRLFAD